ncbi:MAG TPA: T9SS type A sorting domain-containing protein, partial [Ignavibacteriales bacterium]|nr:T9SS type A sorting domain-containing protein [Ignavibacteriales bacterium]
LYFDGQWISDQLFVSLSNRLGKDLEGRYDGNPYAAPDGPYHYWIIGDSVSLNYGNMTGIPEEYRSSCESDSEKVFLASDYARYAVKINKTDGTWDVEMAIYNPNVAAQSKIGFNVGGSVSSTWAAATNKVGDSYAYYTWQPNVPDDPFGDPFGNVDPGFYNLANSDYWAILKFLPGTGDIARKEMDVPKVAADAMTIDGVMDETAWSGAAQVNLVTSSAYEIFSYYYARAGLTAPDFDELYGRLLWSKDTLYVFMHIDEMVDDSTDLYFDGQWISDQLFISLSNRLGVNMKGWYDGNPYAAPDGPYHYWIIGDSVSLNYGNMSGIPEEYRKCFDQSDSQKVFYASDYARYATKINKTDGKWDVEMAIYNPNVNEQASIGFNVGGSISSTWAADTNNVGDSYAYYTWQPNVPDDPFGDPYGNGDPGFYNLANSDYWALLNFVPQGSVGVKEEPNVHGVPTAFALEQNYPNPFNPATTIKFTVPNMSPVNIHIYNTLGQKVATLISNQVFTPGTYSIQWNASKLSSGIYFYSLETNNARITKKMMLLK